MIHSSCTPVVTSQKRSFLRESIIVLGATLLIALFSRISLHLPFTPVSIATQGHVILWLAAFLGSKRAFAAVLLFLFQGGMGFPVFAGGGAAATLVGPSGGYLIGYLVGAFLTGYLVERVKNPSQLKTFGAMAAGNGMFYLFGLPWLATFIGWKSALLLGMAPFLFVDFLKLILISKTSKQLTVHNLF